MEITRAQFGSVWTEWDEKIAQLCERYELEFRLVKTIMVIESSLGLNPRVAWGLRWPEDIQKSESEDGNSWGLMQMRPSTGWQYDQSCTPEKLNNPDYALNLGCQHLAHLWKLFEQAEEWTVKAWNSGATATKREKEGIARGRADQYWAKYQALQGLFTVGSVSVPDLTGG